MLFCNVTYKFLKSAIGPLGSGAIEIYYYYYYSATVCEMKTKDFARSLQLYFQHKLQRLCYGL